jgi:hypothetical protein
MLPETRERFELFVERAELLRKSSYVKFLQESNLSYTLAWKADNDLSNEACQPEDEALLAVATTLRFFTQPRDEISLVLGAGGNKKGTMDELLDDPDVSEEWKEHFQFIVGDLRKKFAGPAIPIIQLSVNNQPLTAWNVFETIFYGDIAHANRDKREVNRQWRTLGEPLYGMLQFSLHNTVADTINAIAYIYRLCQDELNGQPIPAFIPPQPKKDDSQDIRPKTGSHTSLDFRRIP